jgi:hypothetical protein
MGLVLELIDVVGLAILCLVVATQVIVPLVVGKPLFPLLRGSGKSKSERRLEAAKKRVEEARALKEAAETEVEAARLEVEAARLRAVALHTQIQGQSEIFNASEVEANAKKTEDHHE